MHHKQKSRPVVQRIVAVLRQRIIHGQYSEGALIPSERMLAAELGVSRMSVSRALESLVDERIIEQQVGLGSLVKHGASSKLPPGAIAVLHSIFTPPLSSEPSLILQGIVDTLASAQFPYAMVPVASHDYSGPVSRVTRPEQIDRLRHDFGGFLFLEGAMGRQIVRLQETGVPVVVANLEHDLAASATWVDHCRIARTAVALLAALGHRRIGLVSSRPAHAFYKKTLQGYRDSLRQLGLPLEKRLIALSNRSSPLDAYTAALGLLTREPRPSAIVAGRDLHAEGVCQAAMECNLVIGRDLSVIGFDDVSWGARPPILTTFQEPCYELGAVAAQMLIDHMKQPRDKLEQREIAAPLILRRSIGPPAIPPADQVNIDIRLFTDGFHNHPVGGHD